ncbi:UNVERIFIED_CONTAM: hypothetical protein K2H54_046753 [Gekko kuhli]
MKSANKLLDHLSTTEQDRLSEDLENKDEKDLKQLIIQLRAELQHCTEVNKFLKQHVELKSTLAEKVPLDPTPELGINANIELSKAEVKDSATQTMAVEGEGMGLKHEGDTASSEDKGKSPPLNRKREQWQETTALTSNRRENLRLTSRTNKLKGMEVKDTADNRACRSKPLLCCGAPFMGSVSFADVPCPTQ